MIRGVDVSSVQGKVDWEAAKEGGIRFAIIKCSTGNDLPGVDWRFAENVNAARAAGVAIGAYHFGYPLPSNGVHGRSPVEQARIAYDAVAKWSHGIVQPVGTIDGELPPVLDLEWPVPGDWTKWGCSSHSILEWGLEYLSEATKLFGRKPLVYTYPWWWEAVTKDAMGLADAYAQYPLWMADYAHYQHEVPPDGASPIVPYPWKTWAIWQHSGGTMRLPGSGIPVDCNVFNGDEDAFAAFLKI